MYYVLKCIQIHAYKYTVQCTQMQATGIQKFSLWHTDHAVLAFYRLFSQADWENNVNDHG